MADEEQRIRDVQREYLDFLDDEVSATDTLWSKAFLVKTQRIFPRRKTKEHTQLL